MKKVVLLLILVLSALISNAQEVKEYYENGNVKSVGNKVDNKREGLWFSYYETGEIEGSGYFLNDEATGNWISLYKNQVTKFSGSFVNDMQTGEWKFYHENGELADIGFFENDYETGEWKEYYDNGELKSITTYVDGNEIGRSEEYLSNGSPSKKGYNGKNGFGGFGSSTYGPVGNWTYWEYYSNGQLQKKYTKDEDDIYHGDYEYYHENGQLHSKGKYVDDEKEGEWKEYSVNGALASIGNYSNGKREGEWYENRKEIGKYKILYENGEITKYKEVNSQDDPLEDPYYKIRFKNSCEQEVTFAIIILNLDDEWETKGYYKFDSNYEGYLADTENRVFYFYAFTQDKRIKWEGDHIDYVNGNKHSFRKKTIPSDRAYGNYTFGLTCN